MKPSEPSSQDEDDIPFAKHEPFEPSERQAADDPSADEPERPFLIRPTPDPACRFVMVEALIVLVACCGCLGIGIETRRLVDSRPWHVASFITGMNRRDFVLCFFLGLSLSCPYVLLHQYLLRNRRSWPTLPEWTWMVASAWAVCFVTDAVSRHYKVSLSLDLKLPSELQSVFLFFWALSYFLLFGSGLLVILMLLEQPSSGWKCMAWADWLGVAGTLTMIAIVFFDAESKRRFDF